MLKKILISSLCLFTTMTNANILVSIKPLGFITSAVAQGVTKTDILVASGASPHNYSLKPSDVLKIKKADLVLWIGEDVDAFLRSSLESKDPNQVLTLAYLTSFALSDTEAEQQLQDTFTRNKPNQPTEMNWHLWLSPRISLVIANAVANKLKTIYPTKTAKIEENLAKFKQNLLATNAKIKTQLEPVQSQGFYVFHNAFQYFNDAYGLNQLGYFTFNPMLATGAKNLAQIKEKINHQEVRCIFVEPQFTPKIIQTIANSTKVKVQVIDPMGSKIKLGSTSYMRFLQNLANNYQKCLASNHK